MSGFLGRLFTSEGIGHAWVSPRVSDNSKSNGEHGENARLVKTSACQVRLARRDDPCRFPLDLSLSRLRNGKGFKITRHHLAKRLGQSRLIGKGGLENMTLLQIKQAEFLEASVNQIEFGRKITVRCEGSPFLGRSGALVKLSKRMDRADAHVNRVNLLRAQEEGIARRDLCVEATSQEGDDADLERTQNRGSECVSLAINGNSDSLSSKLNRPDLQEACAKLMMTIGWKGPGAGSAKQDSRRQASGSPSYCHCDDTTAGCIAYWRCQRGSELTLD